MTDAGPSVLTGFESEAVPASAIPTSNWLFDSNLKGPVSDRRDGWAPSFQEVPAFSCMVHNSWLLHFETVCAHSPSLTRKYE